MCFSASASFAGAAILAPVGIYTLKAAWRKDRGYLGLAAFPLLFGVQQGLEGGLWLAIGRGDPAQTQGITHIAGDAHMREQCVILEHHAHIA